MIIDLSTPKDMRDAIEGLYKCQKATNDTMDNINASLVVIQFWMIQQHCINSALNKKLTDLERRVDMIMKSLTFSQSSASSK